MSLAGDVMAIFSSDKLKNVMDILKNLARVPNLILITYYGLKIKVLTFEYRFSIIKHTILHRIVKANLLINCVTEQQ